VRISDPTHLFCGTHGTSHACSRRAADRVGGGRECAAAARATVEGVPLHRSGAVQLVTTVSSLQWLQVAEEQAAHGLEII
jgi:hypothetical protein